MAVSRRPLSLLLAAIGIAAVLGVALLVLLPRSGNATNAQVALGASLYRTRCAGCHATTTELRVGPGLAGLFQPGGVALPVGIDYGGKLPNGLPVTEANVGDFIRKGGAYKLGAMPGFSLTDPEMRTLIAYMQTLAR